MAQVCLWHSPTNLREPFSRSRTVSSTSTRDISMSADASVELVSQDTKTCPDIETAYQDAKTNMNTAFEAFKVIEALVAEKGAHSALTQDLNEAFAKFEHANKIFDEISEARHHEKFGHDDLDIIPDLSELELVREVAAESELELVREVAGVRQWSCGLETYKATKTIAYRIFDDYNDMMANHNRGAHPGIRELDNLMKLGYMLAETVSLPSEISSALKASLEEIAEKAKPPYMASVHNFVNCITRTFASIEMAFTRERGLYEDKLEASPFLPTLVRNARDGEAGYSGTTTEAWLQLALPLFTSDTMSSPPLLLESDTMSQPPPLLRSDTNFVGATGDN